MIRPVQAQEKMLDQNLVDKAMTWYRNFLKTLRMEGLDVDNPYALGMVSILQNVEPGYAFCTKEDLRFALFDALQGCPFAFMETDENGRYLRAQTENEPAAEWIIKNMKRVTGITLGHMVKLYHAAEENRLVLRKCDPTGMEEISCKYLKAAEDGSCGITRNYIPLTGEEAAGMLLAEGYADEEVDTILARGEALGTKSAEMKELVSAELPGYLMKNEDYSYAASRQDVSRARMPLVQNAVCAIGHLHPKKMADKGERTAISWKLTGQLC